MTEINRRFFDALMAEKKLSLRGLAAKMGIGHSQLSLTFSGGRRMTLEEAATLSNIFDAPLHKIVEAAGVTVRPHTGKRVPVVGAMRGDGVVSMYDKSVIERTTAPEEMPGDTIAVQCRTSGATMEFMDGWVFFCRQYSGIDNAYLGRVCLCQIKDGPAAVAMVKRGYREATQNLAGPYVQENVALDWATPILFTRN